MRICSKCLLEKEESEFYKDDYGSDGLKRICKSCDNANSKAYYRKIKNKLTQKQKMARKLAYQKWKLNNPDRYKELYDKHNR